MVYRTKLPETASVALSNPKGDASLFAPSAERNKLLKLILRKNNTSIVNLIKLIAPKSEKRLSR